MGAATPPKRDRTLATATEYDVASYWNGYKLERFWLSVVNQDVIRRALEARNAAPLDVEKWTKLFEAYEVAGNYEKAIQIINILAASADSPIGLAASADLPMGLSAPINSHKSKRKRGSKGVTSYAKRMIRSAGAILEERHGRKNLTLGTCTVPTLAPEEHVKVCESWSELSRQFFQELQRLLERKGLDTDYVQVTEIQEKRFEKWGQVAPHLHWVIQGKKSVRDSWAIAPIEVRQIWERLLGNLLGRLVDGSAATRIENPRKSLAGELGKYISKGSKVISAITKAGKGHLLPSAWWGAAKPLKQEIKQRLIENTGELAEFLVDNLEKLRAAGKIWFTYIYQQWIDPISGKELERCVGVVGRLMNQSVLKELLSYGQKKERSAA